MEETERQWGNPRGQQGVTVMTQQKARGVCLDILFHNCHSKQTLEKTYYLYKGKNPGTLIGCSIQRKSFISNILIIITQLPPLAV